MCNHLKDLLVPQSSQVDNQVGVSLHESFSFNALRCIITTSKCKSHGGGEKEQKEQKMEYLSHLEINVDLHIFTNLDKKVYMLLALKQNYSTKAKGVHKHSRAPLSL